MPFELFLALRYLRSRRKRRLAKVTAGAAIGGVTLGVAAFIVALALANGFRDEMRDKILRGTSHLTVMRTDGRAVANHRELTTRIRQIEGVSNAAGTTYDGAVLTGSKGSAYAVLRGIDKDGINAAGDINSWIVEGSFEPLLESPPTAEPSLANVVVGAELAGRTGVHVGDIAEVLPATSSLNARSKRLVKVVGIFRSGLFEYDATWIYLSLDSASAFTENSHASSAISVQTTDIEHVKEIGRRIRAALGDSYTIVDWQDANRPLFTALALERRMGLFIVGLIVLVAMLNIASTIVLVVVERRNDIAILKTMGASRSSITALFMIQGAVIGTVGALMGGLLGLLACLIGNYYKLVSLPADVYSISNVPFTAHVSEIAIAVSIAMALSILATVYPARAAARIRPAETLRDPA